MSARGAITVGLAGALGVGDMLATAQAQRAWTWQRRASIGRSVGGDGARCG